MENEKYIKVLNILRKSKPVLGSTDNIEKEVIKRIARVHQSRLNLSEVIDFLFGWVYIGWVRRSLITASIVLVLVFVYQQSIILKRIDFLSRQTVVIDRENVSTHEDEIEKKLLIYKNSGRRFSSKTITISEKQMKELLESVNELQIKYKDLENLIEEDPELKKLIEKKLIENNRTKINL
ncbi:MAG: hypothetical protein NTX93_07130 [Bacteroidia bacterium]|nr:hypothetical protein [Bacteroidia bacterium]